MPLVIGHVPYDVPNAKTGRHLARASLIPSLGQVAACWGHWRLGDTTFTNKANFVAGSRGLDIWHVLDANSPIEAELINLLQRGGQLFFSPAAPDTPAATRAVVSVQSEALANGGLPWQPGQAFEPFRLGHIAYTDSPAIAQEPVVLLG